ncbi:MAG TPA: CAP domain-containing protein [Holophagaceae bacterium]|jgi:uncharacterized protein YkwD|nr:CAP domain-containing protein [Holophagaceae bacterium]
MRPILYSLLIALHAVLSAKEDPKALAQQVVVQINWARQNPKAAAAELRAWLPLFEGGRYLAFPGEPRLRTQEGPAAVEEAISFLEKQKPMEPVAWSDRLQKAAMDLARDQARHGGLGHQGSDGSMPWGRIARYGTVSGGVGEVATYGTFGDPGDPRRAVLALIVDDGVADRGHRAILYDPGFALAGAAWASHPIYTRMVVVDFATDFLREIEARPGPARREALAQALVEELNRARQDPASCAKELRVWLGYFKPGRVLALPGERSVQTAEGTAAVQQAIDLLEAQHPVPPVQWSEQLSASAGELAESEAGSGAIGHRDGDLDLDSRLARHGGLNSPCGESLVYGLFDGPDGPRKALLSMLVGDGARDRRVLHLLYDPGVTAAGAAWDAHPRFGNVVVLDVAGRLRAPSSR